eukprot:TRINITY_DN42326_c0_g1_i2.p1 TRINITY_DN42326_c0_g1~~TRINITY_DN42326_c0_g1_i2.p1  ORF type:complete len:436 (-),score=37.06 TRINITY_DN42326_c0_g1_i2:149-1456(-)
MQNRSSEFIALHLEHIDGALTLSVKFCFDCIKFAIRGARRELMSDYSTLHLVLPSYSFVKNSTPEEIIETSLLALSSIHDLIIQREDIVEEINFHLQFIDMYATYLISCRLALLLGFFLGHTLSHSADLFKKLLIFLINGALLSKSASSFSIQCAESLQIALKQQVVVKNINLFLKEIMPIILGQILENKSISFFLFIKRIIQKKCENMKEYVVPLVDFIVKRIDIEYANISKMNLRHNMVIGQCLNIIKLILSVQEFFPELLEKTQEVLLPLFGCLREQFQIDFEEEIICIIGELIKLGKRVIDPKFGLFELILQRCQNTISVTTRALPTLNLFLYYGKIIFATQNDLIEKLVKFALFLLKPEEHMNMHKQLDGAVLMQIILQNIKNPWLDSAIPTIILASVELILSSTIYPIVIQELQKIILCAICNLSLIHI